MKKLAIVTALTLLIGGLGVAISTSELPEVAVTPDHPLYDVKTMTEDEVEDLAPNESAKAKAKLAQANKRVAEMDALAERNRTDLMNETAEDYEQEMKGLESLGTEISSLAQKKEINELVAKATSFHTTVLQQVQDRVPKQAQRGISNALNRSQAGHKMASKAVASALMEEGRRDLERGNDQLDQGDNAGAETSYSDANESFGQAEAWLEGLNGTAIEDMRSKLANAQVQANNYTEQVEQYRQNR